MGRGNVLKAPASPLLSGSIAQRLRIASGLILFTFALTHFLNHALGIWSIDAMEVFQSWRTGVTRSTAGTIVLAAAFLTHVTLNLTKLALRSTWRMPVWEAVQIALGLCIPLLLVYHAAYMRSAHVIDGSETAYFDLLSGLWNNGALQQSTLLLLVWTHGCIGLHYWLRLGRFYRRIAPVLLGGNRLPEAAQQATTLTARPPCEVSLYFSLMSRPVWRIVSMQLSSGTKCEPSPRSASEAAVTAFTAPSALRSMQGTWTSPPIGSQVMPR